MIQISKGKLAVEGTNMEIIDDLQDLVMSICMRNNHKEVVDFGTKGYASDMLDYILSLESLLRMIYTCYSVSEEAFNELLKTNRKILEDINKGEFKLFYKEGK